MLVVLVGVAILASRHPRALRHVLGGIIARQRRVARAPMLPMCRILPTRELVAMVFLELHFRADRRLIALQAVSTQVSLIRGTMALVESTKRTMCTSFHAPLAHSASTERKRRARRERIQIK